MQEEPGPESPHSVRSLQVLSTNPPSIKSDRMQKQFDDDVDQILDAMTKGEADRKLQIMTTMIVSFGRRRLALELPTKEQKSWEDTQHQEGDESTEVPA